MNGFVLKVLHFLSQGLTYLKLEMKKSDLESAATRYLNKQKENMIDKWIELFGSPKVTKNMLRRKCLSLLHAFTFLQGYLWCQLHPSFWRDLLQANGCIPNRILRCVLVG